MASVKLEFTVEPFVPGDPGPHVHAAIDAVRGCGLAVDVGPFSTSTRGDAEAISRAVRALVSAALTHGATRLAVQVERDDP